MNRDMCNMYDQDCIEPGSIVEPQVCNCWIDPRGRIHFATDCGHEMAAAHMNRLPRELESEGWIHLSLYAYGYVLVRDRFVATERQIDTYFELKEHAENCDHPARDRMLHALEMLWDEATRNTNY